MKIGIDARLWNETGVGRYIRNLVKNLLEIDATNDYVLFVNAKAYNELKTQNSKLKNTTQKLQLIETNIRWHSVEEQLKFPSVLKKEKLDLVHFPYFSVPIFYDRPYVITIHDLIINHYPTGKATTLPSPLYYAKHLGYQFVIKQAAQHAQKIIAVSQATKDEIVTHLGVPSDKVVVTYEGVGEGNTLKAESQKSKDPFKNQKFLLYVGNAYPHKNLERLIEAFTLVVKEHPEVKLVLVGKEDYFYRRLHEKVKASGMEESVIFAGYVPEGTLQSYYQHAVSTILPSLMEGFGLTGLEAMRAGSLILASDIPSLKEIYQDAALYFDPLAVASIHATIRKVLDKPQSFHSVKMKGEKYVSSFSWKKMAQQTLKIYERSTSLSA